MGSQHWSGLGLADCMQIFQAVSLVAQLVKNLPAMEETRFDSWVGKFPWRRDRLPTPVVLGFHGGSDGKEPNAGDIKRHGFDSWVRKILWRREWQPFPVFLPGKSHGQRSLVEYSPWSCRELDTTEQLSRECP